MPRAKKQHLKRRKDGRFCCVYHGVQFMGNTEEEALAKREEYKRQEQQEGFIRENPTVGQYCERWLPVHCVGIRNVTYNQHVLMLKKLCTVIGDMYVRDVKPSSIKEVYSSEFIGMSDSYIKHAKALYGSVFASAVEDGLLRINPARSAAAKPHKGTTGSHRAITSEERKIIETIATDHKMHPAAIVMLYAGLRPQEVKALRIDRDIDFDKGIIHVRSFVHMSASKHYEESNEGKTKAATRDVPLFAPVRQALEGKKGYIIADKDGHVASKSTWERNWASYKHAIEKKLNGTQKRWYGKSKTSKSTNEDGTPIPWREFDVVPYDLRHSFATWCRDNDVELHTCANWMGHTDATMILKIYDEVTNDRSQKEADRLEKMLNHRRNDMQEEPENPQTQTEQGLAKE